MKAAKLFWIFILSSMIGFLIENGYRFFLTGNFVWHRGVIIGPFLPIYGMGACVFTLVLRRVHSTIKLFILGALIGGVHRIFRKSDQRSFIRNQTLGLQPSSVQFTRSYKSCLFMLLGNFVCTVHKNYPALFIRFNRKKRGRPNEKYDANCFFSLHTQSYIFRFGFAALE